MKLVPMGGLRSATLNASASITMPPRGSAIAQKYPPAERPNFAPISRTISAKSTRSHWNRTERAGVAEEIVIGSVPGRPSRNLRCRPARSKPGPSGMTSLSGGPERGRG